MTQHITQAQAEAFAHRRATKYVHRSAPGYASYAFVPHTLMDFVRDIEAAAIQSYIDSQSAQPARICGMCGYTGTHADSLGQCPKCHWDELRPSGNATLRSALNAMLTQFGMDEDEWNKPTFDQARAALQSAQPVSAAVPPNCGTSFCSCVECVFDTEPIPAKPLTPDEITSVYKSSYPKYGIRSATDEVIALSGPSKPPTRSETSDDIQTSAAAETRTSPICEQDGIMSCARATTGTLVGGLLKGLGHGNNLGERL